MRSSRRVWWTWCLGGLVAWIVGCTPDEEAPPPPPPPAALGIGNPGLNGRVYGLGVWNNDLVAVGVFDRAGDTRVSNVAAWNGSDWRALDFGVFASDVFEGNVRAMTALALDDTSLYVGGAFDRVGADSLVATNIARWNGSTWNTVASGTDGTVERLVPYQNGFIAVGTFSNASTVAARNVAYFDGATWVRLADGTADTVHAATVWGDDIVVGGSFLSASDTVAFNVARWNATRADWEPLGGGLQGEVLDVATFGNKLYATGLFDAAYGSWTSETADAAGDVGQYVSLGVDRFDHWHVAYYDATAHDLKYAVRDNQGAWAVETVDDDGDVGMFCSLEVTEAGTPHIAYYDATNQKLKYARKVAGNWAILTVPDRGSPGRRGQYCSLALGPADTPIIAFYHADSTDVRVASQPTSSTWRVVPVDRRPVAKAVEGVQTAIDVAPDGVVHVVYFTLATTGANGRNLYHAQRELGDSTFVTEERTVAADPRGYDPSIVVDENGMPHVSYQFRSTTSQLFYATIRDGQWAGVPVARGAGIGGASSIALDDAGSVLISYTDATAGNTKLAIGFNGRAPWILSTVGHGPGASSFTSLALLNRHTPRVAYYDATGGNAKVAARGVDTEARRIAEFDEATQTWAALRNAPGEENGLDWWARSLLSYNGELFVGGAFKRAGSVAASRLAGWDGSRWGSVTVAFDAADPDDHVWVLLPYRGSLIAGGTFTLDAGGPGNYVADLGF